MIASKYPEVSDDPAVQARYEQMRASGQSHNMAEMLACRAVPGIRTDSTFMRNADSRNGNITAAARRAARRAGVVTDGKIFMSQLAESPTDPRAWVSGRGDVRRICEERGWSCDGSVTVKGPAVEHDADAPYQVADDLVMKAARKAAEEDPGLASTKKKRRDLIESTREKLQPAEGGM